MFYVTFVTLQLDTDLEARLWLHREYYAALR